MKRTTITMDVCGRVAVPSDAANVWMSEMELVTLFDVISVAILRSGKAHQAAKRLLFGSVCAANGNGTGFPHRHAQRRKGAQRPVGKAVLAKRQTNALAFVRQ